MLLRLLTNFVCCEFKKVKTNLTLFLVFFWIIWFSQIIAISTIFMSLPDIREFPTVTVTELPLEMLVPARTNLEAVIIDTSEKKVRETENGSADILESSDASTQKAEQIVKINDSGGGASPELVDTPVKAEEDIPTENATAAAAPESQQSADAAAVASDTDTATTVNLTAEEVPMPVFSEWAQKQMEAAEKQQAMEQEVVNTATQKKNNTNGTGKAPPLKLRSKNYASPDCGAKIIASNADATNTGAVLSSSKDEYMLSPCGNRIWFVVELCEAIQAQKIDLANFELFSSSPKNFTVAVSNRFPTRDWSNVGRFIADDKRNVQSFDLHPHLFGKFVRVDIHSHYSKEHFCPVSLFRVFGTSEFEAFETENQLNDDIDDFEEEFALEQARAKNAEQNLFKSASDAVLSIVKKAAEVLAKPSSDSNNSQVIQTHARTCLTPAFGQFSCSDCNKSVVERINNALSCRFKQLDDLLAVPQLRMDLLNTQICAKQFGIDARMLSDDCAAKVASQPTEMRVKQSYFLNLLPTEYIGALCQLLVERQTYTRKSPNASATPEERDNAELALNLTIDKKLKEGDFKIIDSTDKKLLTTETVLTGETEDAGPSNVNTEPQTATTEINSVDDAQLQRPPALETRTETASTPETSREPAPDVNIYNVPAPVEKPEIVVTATETAAEAVAEQAATTTTATATTPEATTSTTSTVNKSEEDPSTWDSLDNLLTANAATGGTAPIGGSASSNGANMQQKLPGGPQSESIFIRLSNRIKALERNMSLSGQYLEELSRRYKKQVEELQQTLTQQTQTVRTLEEQNRRHNELELLHAERNHQLHEELNELALQVHACIVVIIFVGTLVFLVLVAAIILYRSLRRQTKELLSLRARNEKRKTSSSAANAQRKMSRRKSFEDFSEHQQLNNEPQRRPSEEAMLILKECGDSNPTLKKEYGNSSLADDVGQTQLRQRKISICYGSSGNLNGAPNNNGNSNNNNINGKRNNGKRKGEKHSWPNTQHAQQQALQHFEQLRATDCAAEHRNGFAETDTFARERLKSKNNNLPNVQQGENLKGGKAKRKSQQNLKRQGSAPGEYITFNAIAPSRINIIGGTEFDESKLLDEDDLDNFIPNADLAYNEFMPDGPSGYQVVNSSPTDAANAAAATKAVTKKSRRLSSPAFFKSPFSKSLKSKSKVTTKTHPPHESTSWEWYRSKKSEAHQQQHKHSFGGFLRASPARSIDSSSLSEIQFPTNSTENSFRILEEAILSSGESMAAATANGKFHLGGSSGGSSSNHSSTSSASKQKNRGLNKILRKVF